MTKFKISDMTTVELSVDQSSDLYFYEDRVFRAINDDYVEHIKVMFDNGFLDELMGNYLFPKTKISDISIEGYSLVVEHENIVHWNYPFEWSFDMLRDAALLVLKVNSIANKYGYQILDGHSSNVTFNMNYLQYIDLGSFVELDKKNNQNWISCHVFYGSFYIPLYLWSKGYSEIARNILLVRDIFNEQEFFKIKYPVLNIVGGNSLFKIIKNIRILALAPEGKITTKIHHPFKRKIALFIHKIFRGYITYEKIKRNIDQIKKPVEHSMWSSYHNNIEPSETKRFVRIAEIIATLKDAKSLMEVASNQGKFAKFVLDNTHLQKIIASDYDKEAVNTMYLNYKNTEGFLPVIFDFVRAKGNSRDAIIHKRYNGDIVVALAVTHHLVLTQNIPISHVFKKLAKFSNKYIIVEFMPMGLYSGNIEHIPILPSFYNFNWFMSNFTQYFDLILDEKLESNRHVFVGKLKI